MNANAHWDRVYQEKDPTTDVSWYQARPAISLEMIQATGLVNQQAVIDVGGGASCLVDCLLEAGFRDVSVLDVSRAALKHAQARLGVRAGSVTWLEANIAQFQPPRSFDLWHDRAVFHFLTSPEARHGYAEALRKGLPPGGHLIVATFAKDGPVQCSGLPVMRYDANLVCAELGSEFELLECRAESHITPWKTEQRFNWFRFQRKQSHSAKPPRA